MSKQDKSKHNQCDKCGKQFATALGFHHHYPNCVAKYYHEEKWNTVR